MSKRILLADDSLTIQKVVELTFMDEDYEVEAVGSGDEAIGRLQAALPSILIADVHMPGASGYEVCRQAKALSPDLPVLLLVGTFEALDEDEMVACGADGNLKKPFDSQELLQVVRRMADGRPPQRVESAAAETIEGLETTSHDDEEAFQPPSAEVTGFDLGPGAMAKGAGFAPPQGESEDPEIGATLEDEIDLTEVDLGLGDTKDIERVADPATPASDAETVLVELEPSAEAGGDSTGEADALGADTPLDTTLSEPPKAPDAEPAAAEVPVGSAGLSDDDVERVARRVVELMSDDAVREVAWDVIPDMAEIVIKARVRELEAEAD